MKNIFIKIIMITVPVFLIGISFVSVSATGSGITGEQILDRIEETQNAQTSFARSTMKVYNDRYDTSDFLQYETIGYTQGTENSYTEFTSPDSIAGLRILSREDIIWAYFPSTGRARPIADNTRNASPTGSGDFNYQDYAMGTYREDYDVESMQEQADYYALKLVPTHEEQSRNPYDFIFIKVKKSDFRIEMINYYMDGALLKQLALMDYRSIRGQNSGRTYLYPMKLVMVNIQEDTMTTIETTQATLDTDVSDCYFDTSTFYRECN